MMRRSVASAAVSLFAVIGASLATTSCSSKTSSETTIAVSSANSAGSAVLVDSTSADSTPPAAPNGAGSTSTALEPSIAVGEPNPATPAGTGAEASVDSAAGDSAAVDSAAGVGINPGATTATEATGPAELTDAQLTSAFTAMGIPVATDKLTCVKEKAGKTDMSAAEPPPEFLRALMSCVPKSLVEANGKKLAGSAAKSDVSKEKAGCFQEKTFETMAALDIAEFTKLLDANAPVDFPADIKAKLKENTKVCVLSDAQFSSLLEG